MLQIYNVQTIQGCIQVHNRKFKKNIKTSNNDRSKLKRNFFIQSINENSGKTKKKKTVLLYFPLQINTLSMVYNFCVLQTENAMNNNIVHSCKILHIKHDEIVMYVFNKNVHQFCVESFVLLQNLPIFYLTHFIHDLQK